MAPAVAPNKTSAIWPSGKAQVAISGCCFLGQLEPLDSSRCLAMSLVGIGSWLRSLSGVLSQRRAMTATLSSCP